MKDLFTSLSATILIALANLGSGVLAARLLGPDGRGELAAVILWTSLIAALGSLGLGDSVVYHSAHGKTSHRAVFASSAVVAAMCSIVSLAIGWVILAYIFMDYRPEVQGAASVFLFFIPVYLFGLYFSCMFQGDLQLTTWNYLRILIPAIYVAGIGVAFLSGHASVMGFAVAFLTANVASALVAFILINRRGWLNLSPRVETLKSLLRYGLKTHVGTVVTTVSERLDQALISLFLAAADLGLYVVSLAAAGIANLLVGTAWHLAFPKIANQPTAEGKAVVFGRYMRLALFLGLAAAIPIYIVAPWLLSLLFGSEFVGASPILRVLLFGMVPLGCKTILVQGLKAHDRALTFGKAELLGLAVGATCLAVLLPLYGTLGVAAAMVIVHSSTFLYLLVSVKRQLGIRPTALFQPTADDWRLISQALTNLRDRWAAAK